MIALTTPYLWYTTRATGLVALVLFTVVVSLGTLVANRIGGSIVGRFELNELHRSLSIVAIAFLALHIVTTVIDSFVATGWISVVVPFTSSYKRTAIAIGAVAFDLIAAVWISSLLKVRVKNQTWRFIHWFSWLAVASALTHGFLAGTDARHGVGLLIVSACAMVVAAAALWRFVARPTRAAGRTALSPLASAPLPERRPSRSLGPPERSAPRARPAPPAPHAPRTPPAPSAPRTPPSPPTPPAARAPGGFARSSFKDASKRGRR
ncbi:MAG TPA: ferric reductase-like transmembrane domain-containing protein [Acidimicrobiales bacterium]|nr:ferric reductase-like transmembrane domain-containing protein [Acidimicrobiales bacterium]